MKRSRLALACGVAGVLLGGLTVTSCVHEREGYRSYHEIGCDSAPRRCAPTGNRIDVDRSGVGSPLGAVRLAQYGAKGQLLGSLDLVQCTVPDVHHFVCRKLPAAASGSGSRAGLDLAPWRMVHGRLINDETADRLHYLNSLQLWRQRLLGGNYER